MLRGLILCGGKSRRMGREKYILPFHHRPLYLHWYEILNRLHIPASFSLNETQAIAEKNAHCIIDIEPSAGPLSGIMSAFESFPDDDWLVIACDLVYAGEKDIVKLMDAYSENCDAIAFENPEQNLPFALLTIFKKSALPYLKEEFASEKKSALAALKKMNTRILSLRNAKVIKGINSQSDWQEWQVAQQK